MSATALPVGNGTARYVAQKVIVLKPQKAMETTI